MPLGCIVTGVHIFFCASLYRITWSTWRWTAFRAHWKLYVRTHFCASMSTSNCHKWAFVIRYVRSHTSLSRSSDKVAVWPLLCFVSPHYCLATGAKTIFFFFSIRRFWTVFSTILWIFALFYERKGGKKLYSYLKDDIGFSKPMTLFDDDKKKKRKIKIVRVSVVLVAVCVSIYCHKYLILIASTESPMDPVNQKKKPSWNHSTEPVIR